MSIASNLRREIDERGLKIETLAGQISCEASSVRKYLAGKVKPSDGVLARFSRVLGIPIEEIKYGRPRERTGKLTTDEVAALTGIDPLSLRIGLQRGIWPFGTAYKRQGSTHFTYVYDPAAVARWIISRDAVRGGRNEKAEHLPDPVDRPRD